MQRTTSSSIISSSSLPNVSCAQMNRERKIPTLISSFFPTLSHTRFVEIQFDSTIAKELRQNPSFNVRDCGALEQLFLREASQKGGDFGYGGWMEHRGTMFAERYMALERKFIHLGVDLNAPTGTPVHFPRSATIVRVTTSDDKEIGWGTRIDLADTQAPLVYLLGHLSPHVTVTQGTLLVPGQQIGVLGSSEENGGCDPHLHLQVMRRTLYESLDEKDLDGYGCESDKYILSTLYPDPFFTLIST